jgi:hypothetical protein
VCARMLCAGLSIYANKAMPAGANQALFYSAGFGQFQAQAPAKSVNC